MQFIRHLHTSDGAGSALNELRSARSVRPMLEALDSLEMTVIDYPGVEFTHDLSDPVMRHWTRTDCFLDLRRWLRARRGPFYNLTRMFLETTSLQYVCLPYTHAKITFTLISDKIKIDPPVRLHVHLRRPIF